MATKPPGWYDDAHGALRWWDGSHWTEHAQALPPGVTPVSPAEATVAPPADDAPAPETEPLVEGPAPDDYLGEGRTSGIFASATAARPSTGARVWTGIGIALLGVVALAAVLIPLLILAFGRVAA